MTDLLEVAAIDEDAAEPAPPPAPVGAPRIALVGNPNSGKTALFNALTGARQKVANYPGVTVERKDGAVTAASGRRLQVVDLPGTYSLRARSPDEEVTRDVVLGRLAGERTPDLLVCVADATNLRLVLRLVLELRAIERPMVLVLNMIDIAERQGWTIDRARLSAELGMPVLTTVATRRRGIGELVETVDALVGARVGVAPAAEHWTAPTAADLRAAHREAERILKACVKPPALPDTWTGRLDRVLLHPAGGVVILMAVLFFMFQAVFTWAQPVMDLISHGFDGLSALIKADVPESPLRGFVTDGLIAGVGSVLVFVPQICVLFFLIILLEDSGYMGRAAFLMDKMMGSTGLHGRAFIPLLSSFACAIPGIMSARVIDNRRDRLTTIMVAPLMTCSARIPVYTLIISAFIPRGRVWGFADRQGLVMFALYAIGIVSALAVAFVMRKLFWRGGSEPFLMELPGYKVPDLRNVGFAVWTRAKIFLKRAGTTIAGIMVVIWVLSSFPGAPKGATQPAINYSLAGMIGHALHPILAPIGFTWEMSVALIPAFAAREVVVAALGTVYAVGGDKENTAALSTTLAHHWSLPTALALLAWFVFAPSCISTLSVVRRETNSRLWPTVMFVYLTALAYGAAFLTYQISAAVMHVR